MAEGDNQRQSLCNQGMRGFLIATLLLSTVAYAEANVLSASCSFKTFSMYRLITGTSERAVISQSMVIRDGETSAETLSADGSARATNSKTWRHVRGTIWVGDFGELLTVDGWQKGFGTYGAVLQDTVAGFWASTYIGECTGDFVEK